MYVDSTRYKIKSLFNKKCARQDKLEALLIIKKYIYYYE